MHTEEDAQSLLTVNGENIVTGVLVLSNVEVEFNLEVVNVNIQENCAVVGTRSV